MKTLNLYLAAVSVSVLVGVLPAPAQITIDPAYAGQYSFVDLGEVPNLPSPYGGLTFKAGDPDTILIGGGANSAEGLLYSIRVRRDATRHIVGFSGTATYYCDAANNDGGVAYGPNQVLFLARWPNNELGQTKPGSTNTDKIISLGSLGVAPSPGGLNFVPPGFPNENQLRICGYDDGAFYSAKLAPDGLGTFSLTSVTLETQIPGGPEGFIYVPPGSPLFQDFNAMLVSEYVAGVIAAYELSTNSAPRPETRTVFISGLTGAEGAVIDPISGDFLFSTFGANNHVIVVRGFNMPPTVAFVSPTNTAAWVACVPNPVTIAAQDFDGQVSKVELYQGATKIAESLGASLVLPWMTNKVGNYTFTARATDNGGAVTLAGPVTISVVPPPINTLVTPGFAGSQGFHLCGDGEITKTYTLQASTNLTTWKDLGPMVRTNGILEFFDPDALGLRRRFYRMAH